MKSFIVFGVLSVIAVCNAGVVSVPATTLVRAPSHDSAIISSSRIGGAFSYSTLEGHAYQAITPVVSNVITPAAYHVQAPVAYAAAPYHYQYAGYPYAAAPYAAAPFAYPYHPYHPYLTVAPVEEKAEEKPAEDKPSEDSETIESA